MGVALSVVASALSAGELLPAASAGASTTFVDRSLTCTTGVHGGARALYLRAQSAYGSGAALESLGQASAATAGHPVPSKPNYRPTLAGQIAAQTLAGKPLVYADVTDSGRARLFTGGACA